MTNRPKIGILTSFAGSDSAYSLINVCSTQIQMFLRNGYNPVLFVCKTFPEDDFWNSNKFEIRRTLNPDSIENDLYPIIEKQIHDIDIMICHDLVFLAQHVEWAKAIRRLAHKFPNITWLHWQHSRGDHVVEEPCDNSYYCYPNNGDLEHVATMNKTTTDRVVYIPHPLDLNYFGWPELAIRIAEDTDYPFVDVAGILPTRLDFQKQVDKAVRIYAGLKKAGKSVCFICADAYATGNRFKNYKQECLEIAKEQGLTDKEFLFLGERYEECTYATPRPVVKALYEMGNLFILPSNSETSSLVAMEAAVAGNMLVINSDFPPIHHLYKKALSLPFGSVIKETKYYRTMITADGETNKLEDPQLYWDDQARETIIPALKSQLVLSVKRQQFLDRWPKKVFENYLEPLLKRVYKPRETITLSARTVPESDTLLDPEVVKENIQKLVDEGFYPNENPRMGGDPEVTAIVCSLDNLPMLQRQLNVLMEEVGHCIVVNNGSADGTREWLDANPIENTKVVHLDKNIGAGHGRNMGLSEWDKNPTPYTLMLDGGILPPYKGVKPMKEYLLRHPEATSISPEIATCYTVDENEATIVYNQDTIEDGWCFPQKALSGTAYGLYKAEKWNIRFSEEGPFGEPGWGVDDNEIACRWRDAGLVHMDFTDIAKMKLFRRQSGSHQRLFEETGIWPTQYGSVYEKRLVKLNQDFPEYMNMLPEISCVVLGWNEYPIIAKCVKRLHEELEGLYHEIIVVNNGSTDGTKKWMDNFCYRQTWGNATIDEETKQIINRSPENEETWATNFIPIHLSENMGAGHGYNVGFEKARGQFIFYLSGDILISKGSVRALVDYLKNNPDSHYAGFNANVCQGDDENRPFVNLTARQGLGNYAYSYAVIKREVWDEGIRFADFGPFEGAGCGYEELDFAYLMYQKGYKGYLFNDLAYYHQRRDGARSGIDGHDDMSGQKNWSTAGYDERKKFLCVRWNKPSFGIRHYQEQPPDKKFRRIAMMNNIYPNNPGPAGFLAMAMRKIGSEVDQFDSLVDVPKLMASKEGDKPTVYDSYIFVDDGDNKHWTCPELAHPSKYWTIDMYNPSCFPYSSPEEYLAKLRTFDEVFCTSQSAVEFCNANGVNAIHLPHAANEDYHKLYSTEDKIYPWIAVWSNYGDREEYSKYAMQYFPDGFVGSGYFGDDYPKMMSRAKCALSIARGYEYPARVVETMMIGTPLVSRRDKYLDTFFKEGEHYLGFSDKEEMCRKIFWVLEHPNEAEQMASRAKALVLKEHRYYHRALTMFSSEFWYASQN